MSLKKIVLLVSILILGCNTGNLTVVADMPKALKEASALEVIPQYDYIWTIEDSGNKKRLYAIDTLGTIVRNIKIKNAKNMDWEDLTSDSDGNVYIGDFGNNSKKRASFTIYKVSATDLNNDEAEADKITFTIPKDHKSKDFEAFFLWSNHFYIFSKEDKKFIVLKVPNRVGDHKSEIISEYNLEGKNNKITAADIRDDGKEVLILNHDKLWRLKDFEGDGFFSGTVEVVSFNHSSQKEGLCYKTENVVYIGDERTKIDGGNLYKLTLD